MDFGSALVIKFSIREPITLFQKPIIGPTKIQDKMVPSRIKVMLENPSIKIRAIRAAKVVEEKSNVIFDFGMLTPKR